MPVEAEAGPSSKSGDAIAVRFTRDLDGSQCVIVVDAGFSAVGQDVVDHITGYYGTRRVDLMISTHPDGDHLNGLNTVIEQLDVDELLIHRPRLHASDVSDFTNLEAVDALIAAAATNGTRVTEPFQGLLRFEHQVLVLGPTRELYDDMLAQHLVEERTGVAAQKRMSKALSAAVSLSRDLLAKVLPFYPPETLGEGGETSPRNETSMPGNRGSSSCRKIALTRRAR